MSYTGYQRTGTHRKPRFPWTDLGILVTGLGYLALSVSLVAIR